MKVNYNLSIDDKFYYEKISFNKESYLLKLPIKEADEDMVTWLKAKSPRIFSEERTKEEIKKEIIGFEKLKV